MGEYRTELARKEKMSEQMGLVKMTPKEWSRLLNREVNEIINLELLNT